MLVEFSIVPMSVGESLSQHVAKVIDIVDRSGLPYRTHAMGTVIEGSWSECFAVIKRCHDAMRKVSPRVYTRVTVDDRKGAKERLTGKLASIEKKLGRAINK